jgi:hypothetical protein
MQRVVMTWAAAVVVVLAMVTPAAAHEERESQFPAGTGTAPTYRPFDEATPRIVVCKADSPTRIAAIADPTLRALNERLLAECAHEHLQAAVDAVTARGTNIYVLPGRYREEPSWDPPCTADYDGGLVDYDLIVSCGEVINLVTVAGDDPADDDIVCDNQLCDLQIEGTGAGPGAVVFTGGFRDDGDWVKHNGIKADRADGFYLRNMTWEIFRENAIYVHETDGYTLDGVVARKNDLYGILTFTSDHGLIKDCETYYNGDSGIYPGSAADVNGDNDAPPPLDRWAVEITGCSTHHNALGFSGTAGNSVYFHDNEVHHNGAGYVTDSFVGGHPGMPQDHAWLTNNRIWGNNVNYYGNVQEGGPCRAEKPADRGHQDGVVCPAFPVPVGTGVLIAGGNLNLLEGNEIYDNWRAGAMLFWIPGAIRGDMDPLGQLDTSNGNQFRSNRLGRHPEGVTQPNGMDFWWDDQGVGNCWQDNDPATGEVTHNTANVVLGLPDCDSGGSVSPLGNAVKSATLLPCSTYDRNSEPAPDGCDWFTTPDPPAGREEASTDADRTGPGIGNPAPPGPTTPPAAPDPSGNPITPVTGGGLLASLAGLALVGAAVRRRR